MTTFSQLVDAMVTELQRPDLRAAMASYVNQTVRELHFRPNTNAPILYDANRNEEELTITTDNTWLWSLPSVSRFQDVEAIYLLERGIYSKRKNPRISKEFSFVPDAESTWYRGGANVAVSGVSNGMTAQVSYFLYPQMLGYQVASARIVTYDIDSDTYERVNGGEPTEEELAAVTHWMLQRWSTTIEEGVRAKTWKRVGDETRARMSFSAFESSRTALWNGEPSS